MWYVHYLSFHLLLTGYNKLKFLCSGMFNYMWPPLLWLPHSLLYDVLHREYGESSISAVYIVHLEKYKEFDCCTLQISWKSRCHMTTLPKHDRYPINMINITVSTKCQQIKTYAHIREKNKTTLTAITSSKGYLYTLTGDWYFCTILSLCYNFVEFSAPFITPFHTKLIDIRM